jgi:hypothetical protein
MLAWCTSMPIYFLLSIVLCSVPSVLRRRSKPTPKGRPFHNAFNAAAASDAYSCGKWRGSRKVGESPLRA